MISPNITPKISPQRNGITTASVVINILWGISLAIIPSKIKDKKGKTNAENEIMPTISIAFCPMPSLILFSVMS